MSADTRIETNTVNDLLGIQPLHLGISIQFVEVADTQSQVGVGKQFNSLSFGEAHEQSIDILLNSTLLQEFCKSVCSLYQTSIIHISTDNNPRRIKVIIQSFTLAQKLRAEDNIVTVEFLTHRSCITNRNSRLDDHNSFRVILNNQLDYSFHCAGVEKVLLTIIVGRCSNYHEVSVAICFLGIQRCR